MLMNLMDAINKCVNESYGPGPVEQLVASLTADSVVASLISA